MIEIRMLTPEFEDNYRQFLLSNSRSMIYSTVEYINFLSSVVCGVPSCWLCFRNGEIKGALPYFRAVHKDHGSIINSLPWYGSHGGCILSGDGDDDVRRALLLKYSEAVSNSDVLASTLILTPFENPNLDKYIEALEPLFIDRRIGQITPLPEGSNNLENRLLMFFKQKTRNLVRKSLKQGFSLMVTDEEWAWKFLYQTHLENISAMGGRAKPWDHFMALRHNLPARWRELSVAMFDGKPVSALLLLYFNNTVEYFTPVIKHEYRSQQPLSFLIWHGMVKSVKNGYRWWNWGGTWESQSSLHHFKSGWGANDFPYTYLINTKRDFLKKIKDNIDALQTAFPYFYIVPFSALKMS